MGGGDRLSPLMDPSNYNGVFFTSLQPLLSFKLFLHVYVELESLHSCIPWLVIGVTHFALKGAVNKTEHVHSEGWLYLAGGTFGM